MQRPYSLLLPLVLVIGVVALADVSSDYDRKTDFSPYHTYSWIGVKAGNQLWQDRITSAVDNQLAARGWTKVSSGGDASVSAFGRTQEQDTLQTFYDGFPGWGWRGWGGVAGMVWGWVRPPRTVNRLKLDPL